MAFWRLGGGHGSRRCRSALLAASERLYGALLVLYPKSFRHRYAAEMRQDFGDLAREGLEGGGKELARVWAATLLDLAVTAAQERGTMLMRDARLPLAPRVAARLAVAIVLIAVSVTIASLAKTPQYEGSAKILIGQEHGGVLPTWPPRQVQELTEATVTLAEAMESRPMAEDAIERLGLSTTPQNFLERLNAEPIENTQFIEVSYTDPNPRRAQLVANTVGEILSKEVSEANHSDSPLIATVWEQAAVPKEPVSPTPLRNGLVVLVLGLMLIAGLALPAWSAVVSGVGDNARRMTRPVSWAASGARGTSTRAPFTEAAKEKELLEALRRRGKLTVAGVALETSLSVEEADRMLSALAAKGHLQVRVEHGRLLYSLWEGDAPL
jgi:capsular polysaccharide biosynthesis protein